MLQLSTVRGFRIGDRAALRPEPRRMRRLCAVLVFAVSALLALFLEHDRHHGLWQTDGRLAWSLTVLAAVALIARGIFLGRPVTVPHALTALAVLAAGLFVHALSFGLLGDLLVASAGWVLTWSVGADPQPDALPRVWSLVDVTHGDPLAPFTMHSRKSAFFSADGSAMLAYRARMGFAVVSGDPIGNPSAFGRLIANFTEMCDERGWRILVLGSSQRRVTAWTESAVVRPRLRAIPFGRDVVIDVAAFDMIGRSFRNLRQAVRRTHNAGVCTEVLAERDLDDATRAELLDVMESSHGGVRTERGFSMILDGTLEGRQPGIFLAIGRDSSGQVQAFHRYAVAGGGTDVSLDVPWRRRGAPNGIDERLTVDMIDWARKRGAERLSLAFAAFPEIFDDQHRGPVQRLFFTLIHAGDALIRLESLYRYLGKYHALGEQRYVLLALRHVLPALIVLLTLEFWPRRRQLPHRPKAVERAPDSPLGRAVS